LRGARSPAALCRILVYTLALSNWSPHQGLQSRGRGTRDISQGRTASKRASMETLSEVHWRVHRATSNRYWFDRVSSNMRAQFDLIRNARRLTLAELQARTAGITMPSVDEPPPPVPAYIPSVGFRRPAFDITQHVTIRRRDSRNMWAQCPSCEKAGKDRGRTTWPSEVRSSTVQVLGWMHEDDIRAACGAPPARRF